MSPASIRTRTNSDGSKTFKVVYRMGGRAYAQKEAGSFRGWPGGREGKRSVTDALREARLRRDLVGGWIAAGMSPDLELAKLTARPTHRTLQDWFQAFLNSRVDVSDKTLSLYRNAQKRILDSLHDTPPQALTPAHIQEWVAASDDLSPATVKQYLSTLRQVLDYADIEPNPARSRKVRLPVSQVEEPQPPTSREWQHIQTKLGRRYQLILRLIEACGLRLNEALTLTYGDIDFTAERLRVSRARTKGRTAGQRWLPVPVELTNEIEDLVPLEDRHRERQVFPQLTDAGVRSAFYAACNLAGTVSYSPHELRHRRISLWVSHGIDPVQVKTWAGHSKVSMSLDVYSHIVVEPHSDEWRGFWLGQYQAARRGVFTTGPEADVGGSNEDVAYLLDSDQTERSPGDG